MSTTPESSAPGSIWDRTRARLRADRPSHLQALRTILATLISAVIAHTFGLPQPVWAVVTTILVMQSSLGTAWRVSQDRLIGTAIGAASGALLQMYMPRELWVFALGMFLMAGLCAVLRQPHSAYRFAAITLAIIALPTYVDPPWVVSLHRFFETVIGIIVGMIVMASWRSADPDAGTEVAGRSGSGARQSARAGE